MSEPHTSLPTVMRHRWLFKASLLCPSHGYGGKYEFIWGRFTWCGQRSAPRDCTLPVTFGLLLMGQWVPWRGWTAAGWGLWALFLTLQMIPWKIFSKSCRSRSPEKYIVTAWSWREFHTKYFHGFVLLSVSKDKSMFYWNDIGDKYIECCEILQYKAEESLLRIRVPLRLDGVSIVVSWLWQQNFHFPGEYSCKFSLSPGGSGYTLPWCWGLISI